MADREYPRLAPGVIDSLKVVVNRMKRDEEYLDDPLCPYDDGLKNWLRNINGTKTDAAQNSLAVVDDWDASAPEAWDDVATKARQLYAELEKAQVEADTGETVQIIKAKAGLLERLISVGDKSMSHKKVAEFNRIMHAIMDDVLTPDQRTRVIEMMGDQ